MKSPYERQERGSAIYVNDVRVDTLLTIPSHLVLHPLPKDERFDKYLYRGVKIGRLALNLIEGKGINSADDMYMHITHSYPDAAFFAESHSKSVYPTQEALDFYRITGSTRPFFPKMVLGIDRKYEDNLVLHPVTESLVIAQEVPFADIDPYSQTLLGDLFEVDLSEH